MVWSIGDYNYYNPSFSVQEKRCKFISNNITLFLICKATRQDKSIWIIHEEIFYVKERWRYESFRNNQRENGRDFYKWQYEHTCHNNITIDHYICDSRKLSNPLTQRYLRLIERIYCPIIEAIKCDTIQ